VSGEKEKEEKSSKNIKPNVSILLSLEKCSNKSRAEEGERECGERWEEQQRDSYLPLKKAYKSKLS
jgi:hypothetical protein